MAKANALRFQPLYLLASLFVLYTYLFVDRQIPALLVEPLKTDFLISDTEVSLLHGLAFAVPLGLFGLVAGRLADTQRRVMVIAVGLSICSFMTIASGFISSYAGLLVCRVGVGIGQAAFTPAAYSLIADSFDRKRLGLALGLFGVGPYLGTGGAYVVGGLAVQQSHAVAQLTGWAGLRSWQLAFLLVGVAGAVLALWSWRLNEAPRRVDHAAITSSPSGRAVIAYFRENLAAFASLKLSAAFASMATYAIVAWYPSHLIRGFGWSAADAAAILGPLLAVTGALGVTLGGWVADEAVKRRPHGRSLVMAICSGLAVPLALAAPLIQPGAGLVLLALAFFLATATIGINPSATMAMMPGRMRGVATAIGVLVVNLLGLGLGPTTVAIFSDSLLQGPAHLSIALAIALPMMLTLSALCAGAGFQAYARSVARFEVEPSRQDVTKP